jgi:DNA invertase Pin-like site-specific DNA recombinase
MEPVMAAEPDPRVAGPGAFFAGASHRSADADGTDVGVKPPPSAVHRHRRRVVGYVTVTDGTTDGLDDAAATIREACDAFGYELSELVTDRDTGRRSLQRPGVGYALDVIAAGTAAGLVVSDLMLLVRSAVDLASFLRWFRERDAVLIALDLAIDTSTAEGRHVADVLIRFGEREQARIAEKTKNALEHAKANGRPVGPPSISDHPELRQRIEQLRAAGMTLQAIADRLNADGIPTLRGGARWRPSSVQAALGYRRPSAPGRSRHEACPGAGGLTQG